MALSTRTLFLVTIVFFISCRIGQGELVDYYWKNYTGEIPSDAVDAGADIKKPPIYIGQVLIPGHGLQVVSIYPGKEEVVASHRGIHKTKNSIKILCSKKNDKLLWVPVDGKTLHSSTILKHAIVGGMEKGGDLTIGRVMYKDELIVGKISSYARGHARIWFPYKNDEKYMRKYEILIYDSILPSKK